MAQEVVFRIDVLNQKQTLGKLVEVEKALRSNAKAQRETKKAIDEGGDSTGQLTKKLEGLKKAELEGKTSKQQLTKQIKDLNTHQKSAIGSNERMRASLAILTKRYNGLSKEQRTNTTRGKNLQKQIKSLSDELKNNESAVGNNTRNVGNYRESVEQALKASGLFGGKLGEVANVVGKMKSVLVKYAASQKATTSNVANTSKALAIQSEKQKITTIQITGTSVATSKLALAQKAMITGTSGATKALKIFRLALISTGVGAIVVVIGSLIAAMSKMQPVIDAVSVGFAAVGAVVDVLVDRLANIGGALIKIATGNFSEGIDELTNSLSGMGDELQREIGLAADLQRNLIAIEQATLIQSTAVAKARAEIQRLNATYQDTNISLEEQLASQLRIKEILIDVSESQAQLAREQIATTLGFKGVGPAAMAYIDQLRDIGNLALSTGEKQAKFQRLLKGLGISKSTQDDFEELTQLVNTLTQAEQERFAGVFRSNQRIVALENKIVIEAKKKADAQKKADEAEEKKRQKKIADTEKLLSDVEKSLRTETEALEFELGKRIDALEKAGVDEALINKFKAKEFEKIEKRKSQIALEEIEKRGDDLSEAGAVEILQLQAKANAEIALAQGNKEAIEQIEREKQKAVLELTRKGLADQLQELTAQFNEATASIAENGGIQGLILSDEDKESLNLAIAEVEEQISALDATYSNLGAGEDEEGSKGLLELMGMDEEGMEKFAASMEGIQMGVQLISDIVAVASQNRINQLEEEKERAIANAGENSEKKKQIEADFNKKIQEERKRAAKKQQKIQIVQTIITGIGTVLSAFKAGMDMGGIIPAVIFAALAAATVAASVAAIKSQKFKAGGVVPKARRGHVIQGPSHGQGGVPVMVNGQHKVEAEGGEPILTAAVGNDPHLLAEASRLNVRAGGVPLMQAGGIVPQFAGRTQTSAQVDSEQVAQLIGGAVSGEVNRIQVVNNVTDTSAQQRSVANVETDGTF